MQLVQYRMTVLQEICCIFHVHVDMHVYVHVRNYMYYTLFVFTY